MRTGRRPSGRFQQAQPRRVYGRRNRWWAACSVRTVGRFTSSSAARWGSDGSAAVSALCSVACLAFSSQRLGPAMCISVSVQLRKPRMLSDNPGSGIKAFMRVCGLLDGVFPGFPRVLWHFIASSEVVSAIGFSMPLASLLAGCKLCANASGLARSVIVRGAAINTRFHRLLPRCPGIAAQLCSHRVLSPSPPCCSFRGCRQRQKQYLAGCQGALPIVFISSHHGRCLGEPRDNGRLNRNSVTPFPSLYGPF